MRTYVQLYDYLKSGKERERGRESKKNAYAFVINDSIQKLFISIHIQYMYIVFARARKHLFYIRSREPGVGSTLCAQPNRA